MAYDGLIYSWPYGGQRSGIPFDLYDEFQRNKHLYDELGRPYPHHSNVVNEPDGSSWRYDFAYTNPFSYEYKVQTSTPVPGFGNTPAIPGIDLPGTGLPGSGTVPPAVNPPAPEPAPAPVTPPGGSPAPIDDGGNWTGAGASTWGDLLPLAGLGVLGLALGFRRKRKVSKRK